MKKELVESMKKKTWQMIYCKFCKVHKVQDSGEKGEASSNTIAI